MFDIQIPYVKALADAGLQDLSFQDLIALKMFDVRAPDVRIIREDFPSADARAIMGIKLVKDDPAGACAAVAFPAQSLETIMALSSAGVKTAYVTALRKAGVRDLTADNVAAIVVGH